MLRHKTPSQQRVKTRKIKSPQHKIAQKKKPIRNAINHKRHFALKMTSVSSDGTVIDKSTTAEQQITPPTHPGIPIAPQPVDEGSLTLENALTDCLQTVRQHSPFYHAQAKLLPPSQRPLFLGLRSLLTQMDTIPEKTTNEHIILMKAAFWRQAVDKMRIFIMDDVVRENYGENSREYAHFKFQYPNREAPQPLAPIRVLSQAIVHNGVGFDFKQLDSMLTSHVDLYKGQSFQDMRSYIQHCDQHVGLLNMLTVTCGAHEVQKLEESQPLAPGLMKATIQLGRVEGLFRLLSHQPLTFAQNHTWIPRDLLNQFGIDNGHIASAGSELLRYPNSEWFKLFNEKTVPNVKVECNNTAEYNANATGEEDLEKELHKLRQADPYRKDEGLNTTMPAHLIHPPIKMDELRTGLKEANKVIYNIAREQLNVLRNMSGDVPKQLKPYFYQTYITEIYLDRLKEYDFDTLHPEMDVWSTKDMLKLNLKMSAGSTFNSM